jgi:hypothetical protein
METISENLWIRTGLPARGRLQPSLPRYSPSRIRQRDTSPTE